MLADRVKTKNQLAYETLKAEIIEGKYEPGEKLVISSIAKRYGFSVIPIREVLNALESEGFVTGTPFVGYVVKKPEFRDHNDLAEIRQLLEGHAIGLAAKRITPAALKKLKLLVDRMKQAVSESDMTKIIRLNHQFHDLIYSSCGNQILYNLIQQVFAMAPRAASVYKLVKFIPSRAEPSISEHEEIYHCLAARDARKAQRVLYEHKQRTYDLLIKHFDAESEMASTVKTTRIGKVERKKEPVVSE